MIELIVLACLISDPNQCQSLALKYAHDATSMRECAMGGQIETARWSGDHPDWRVMKMSCVRPSQTAQADNALGSAQANRPERLASRIVD